MVEPRKRGKAIHRFQDCHFMRAAGLSVPLLRFQGVFGIKPSKQRKT